MANILNYMRWRGDLPFSINKFNSIDAAFFATFVYLPFPTINKKILLSDLASEYINNQDMLKKVNDYEKEQLQLIPFCKRYGDLEILDWTNMIKTNPPVQFSAATFRLNKNTILVAFRGTDGSMIGIKEDIDLSFHPKTSGLTVAKHYLQRIATQFNNDNIYIVGHSKGGMFSQYAAIFASQFIQDRIIKVYSFDGPGLMHNYYSPSKYKEVLPKFITYIPEGSIFGLMLDHPEHVLVVKSNANMLKQHNIIQWEVARNGFVLASNGLTNASRILRHSFISVNTKIPINDRESLWMAIFSALESQNVVDFSQLRDSKLRSAINLSQAYMSLSPQLKIVANEVISIIATSAKNHINIPFINKAKLLKPLSNNSNKGPIVDDSYDQTMQKNRLT